MVLDTFLTILAFCAVHVACRHGSRSSAGRMDTPHAILRRRPQRAQFSAISCLILAEQRPPSEPVDGQRPSSQTPPGSIRVACASTSTPAARRRRRRRVGRVEVGREPEAGAVGALHDVEHHRPVPGRRHRRELARGAARRAPSRCRGTRPSRRRGAGGRSSPRRRRPAARRRSAGSRPGCAVP